nr:protein of unknown function [Escherichia coli]
MTMSWPRTKTLTPVTTVTKADELIFYLKPKDWIVNTSYFVVSGYV